jgi:hypothetical protein
VTEVTQIPQVSEEVSMHLYYITKDENVPNDLKFGLEVGNKSNELAEASFVAPSIIPQVRDSHLHFFSNLRDVKTHLGYTRTPVGNWSLLQAEIPTSWIGGERNEYGEKNDLPENLQLMT